MAELKELPDRQPVILGGMMTSVRVMTQQRGRNANQQYARLQFEDLSGGISSVMFADAYSIYKEKLKVTDKVAFVRAEVDKSREEVGLIIEEIIELSEAPNLLTGSMVISLLGERHDGDCVDRLARVLAARKGQSPVYLEIATEQGFIVQLKTDDKFSVACDDELVRQVEDVVGEGQVRLAAPMKSAAGAPAPPRKQYSKAGA